MDYEYNGLGQVTDVGGATGYLLAADYNALGQVNQYTLGTSEALTVKKAYITNTYEEGTDRLKRSLTTDATRSVQDLNLTYDKTGDVTSVFDTANLSGTGASDYQCYTYDGYQRLTDAWTPSTASCATSGRTTTNLGGASPYWTTYTYTSSGLRTTETAHTGTGNSTKTYTDQYIRQSETVCFGRLACNHAYSYSLAHPDDVAGAKHIAATYCLSHAAQCQSDARVWERTYQAGDEFVMAVAAGEGFRIGEALTGCSFSPDTPVLMEGGKAKAIGKVKPGDHVEAADQKTAST
ncbi:hypothetical protein ABZ619_39920 [Streptomyces sp. NPDC007851]|uniref:hypothetical protein n=1 Tax=Streptomyces sp. NPDC007851 TaxID=3155008 RepID=UPI0033E7AE54